MKVLEFQKTHATGRRTPFVLEDHQLPFILRFGQIRSVQLLPQAAEKTDSDGQTSGDGSGPGSEDFDWLKDD